jgi:Winged helix DNA-binding domain
VSVVPQLSWAQVTAARLDRHGLAEPLAGATPAQVAARICGAHAQVMTAAEWSIGHRLAGATRADVHAALWRERSLVKTFGPRGTVHLLSAADLALWTGALSALPRPDTGPASAYLTSDQTDAVLEAIGAALMTAELTVDELGEAVADRCGSWAADEVIPAFTGVWPRWRHAVRLAAARGVLCFGADRDRKVTYTSPRRWLPGFEPAGADSAAALRWLVLQYLTAYGPATADDFGRWLGVPRRVAAEVIAAHADILQEVELAGTRAWLPTGARPVQGDPLGVRLLPYFDAYVVGGQPRRRLFPGVAAERALVGGKPGGQAGTKPVLLVDGVVAGLWQQRRAGRALAVTVEPFGDLTASQHRELRDQAERLGEFHGCAAVLTLGPVTARSHL